MRRKLFFMMLLGIMVLSGCSFLYQDPAPPESESIIDVTGAEEAWELISFAGVTQDGENWSTDDMDNKWWIAKTIFTRCPTVCRTMTPNMVALQDAMKEEGLDIQIISFTVDPEFDTPERLKDYGDAYGASFDNWQFISGYTQEDIEELALESFKARVLKVPDQNDIVHPVRFYLINGDGQVVRMYNGESNFDLDAYIDDMKYLINN